MRVLVVAEQLRRAVPGGVGTYASGLLRGLAEVEARATSDGANSDGVDSDGANSDAANSDAANSDAATARADITLHASRPTGLPDPLAAFGFPVRTSPLPAHGLTRAWDVGLVRAPTGYDVVHSVSLAFPRPARRRSRPGRGPRLTVMVHDLTWRSVTEAFPPRGRRWHEAALGRALDDAAALIVPSEATAAALRAATSGSPRTEVIEEGCDHLPPPDHEEARRILEDNGVVGPFVLSVGTREPRKNLTRVMAAYGAARSRLPEPWPLVVVGPRGWGQDARPGPGVVVVGAVEAAVLAALYAGARCVVYAPLLEGFGLPAVEAMAQGTPVVASPMPSTAGAAVEVDPLDVGAMADAIVAAATDEELRARKVAEGRVRAGRLTWEAAAARHLEVWRSLC